MIALEDYNRKRDQFFDDNAINSETFRPETHKFRRNFRHLQKDQIRAAFINRNFVLPLTKLEVKG